MSGAGHREATFRPLLAGSQIVNEGSPSERFGEDELVVQNSSITESQIR